MEAELCPLDDRRSASEVSLKLAVVHFTTMTAYCHLLSMRGDPAKIIIKKMMLFFIFPGSIIIQHVIGILAIIDTSIVVRFKKPLDSALLRSSLKRAPFILFGAIDQHPSEPRPQSSNEESLLKILGRLVVILALGAQCVGSCVVFARRYRYDAATIADWRVLELAIAALLICLLTVVHLLWHPSLRLNSDEILEAFQDKHLTYLDSILLHGWGVPALVDSCSSKDEGSRLWQQTFDLFFGALITFSAYLSKPWEVQDGLLSVVRRLFFGGLVGKMSLFADLNPTCDECAQRLWYEICAYLCQIVCFAMILGSSAVLLAWILVSVMGKAVRSGPILLRVVLLIPLSIFACGLASVLWFILFMGIISSVWVALMCFNQIGQLVIQLIVLAYWPTDQECPLLWSDPNANFLWHLM